MTTPKWAGVAVAGIVRDLSDRRGLGNEWEQIDEDIQGEIRKRWEAIILAAWEE